MAKKEGRDWIAKATKNKGGLHRTLGKKPSERITKADIAKAKRMGGKAAKQAHLAETLAKLRPKRTPKRKR